MLDSLAWRAYLAAVRTLAEIKSEILKLSKTDQDELRHWLDVHQDTEEIIELVVRLTQSYAIWWMFMEEQNAKKFEEVKREYLDFFEPVAHLLLWEGFFVIFAQIFARDSAANKSKHIHALIAEVRAKDEPRAAALNARIENSKELLAKVKTIRNKISAHRESGWTPQRLLKVIDPVRRDLDEALRLAQEMVCEIAEALDVERSNDVRHTISSCESSTRNHTFQVLEALLRDLRRNDSSG